MKTVESNVRSDCKLYFHGLKKIIGSELDLIANSTFMD